MRKLQLWHWPPLVSHVLFLLFGIGIVQAGSTVEIAEIAIPKSQVMIPADALGIRSSSNLRVAGKAWVVTIEDEESQARGPCRLFHFPMRIFAKEPQVLLLAEFRRLGEILRLRAANPGRKEHRKLLGDGHAISELPVCRTASEVAYEE